MSKSLILSLNSALAKYSRLSKKVNKSISKGEFFRYTQRKRRHLLAKIEKLKRRISEIKLQMKFAGAGLATAGLFMTATGAFAQNPPLNTAIGPFNAAPLKNPFPPRLFYDLNYVVTDPVITYLDWDNDGDQDALESFNGKYPKFFVNSGTKEKPFFIQTNSYELGFGGEINWFGNYSNPGRVVAVDVDNDGDKDIVIGMAFSNYGDNSIQDDELYFFRNTGTPSAPSYSFEGGYAGITVERDSWPAFGDYDKDGDLDLAVYGAYEDTYNDVTAYVQFFRNDSPAGFKGDPTYKKLNAPQNPLYLDLANGTTSIAFADLDKDGDDDFFWNDNNGIQYKRNDNGTFVEQTGAYKFAVNGASTGNPLAITGLELSTFDIYRSFAFADIDGDGDLDLTMPTNNKGTLNAKNFYIENTGNGVMKVVTDVSNPMVGFDGGYNASTSFIDFDKDGDLDVLAAGTMEFSAGEVTDYLAGHVLFRNDNLKFTQVGLANDPFAAMPVPLADGAFQPVDVDNDGDFDLITTSRAGYYSSSLEVRYFRNDGGKFVDTKSDESSPFSFLSGNRGLDIAFADLDGDGLNDFVHTKYGNHMFAYRNIGTKGNPSYQNMPGWEAGFVSTSYEKPTPRFVDIDNDGDMDITYGKYGNIWLYQNIGNRTAPQWLELKEYQSYDESSLSNPFAFIGSDGSAASSFMDFDGDGDKDLLFGNANSGSFEYYENQNPAPVVAPSVTAAITLTPKVAITLDPNVTLDDTDKDVIRRVTARITPYTQGQERLQFKGTPVNVTVVWADSTGTLTISGQNATYADFENAIENIQYIFTGPSSGREGKKNTGAGKIISKTVTVTALDSDLTIGSNVATYVLVGDDGLNGSAAPVITSSEKQAAAGGNVAISLDQLVSDADGDLDLSTLQITSEQGAKVIFGNGIVTIDYASISNFTGNDIITVSVCDSGGRCANNTFSVEVGADAMIFTGMSPNGDGLNDIFTIQYLPGNTHVSIYNRWGEVIFETGDYDINIPEQRFEGKNKNGTEVVGGSYFYKIKFPDGRVKTGYLLLNR